MNTNSNGKIRHAADIFSLLPAFFVLGNIKLGSSSINWFKNYEQTLILTFFCGGTWFDTLCLEYGVSLLVSNGKIYCCWRSYKPNQLLINFIEQCGSWEPIFFQVVKNFRVYCGTRQFITVFTKPINEIRDLRQINQPLSSHSVHFSILFPCTPMPNTQEIFLYYFHMYWLDFYYCRLRAFHHP